jgi:hypothetical protein
MALRVHISERMSDLNHRPRTQDHRCEVWAPTVEHMAAALEKFARYEIAATASAPATVKGAPQSNQKSVATASWRSSGNVIAHKVGRLANLPAIQRASQMDIRKGLVAFVAALLYASPRDLACSVNVFICVCMNSL